jgi:translation initiation factor 1 (eIF-1/SUI1)
MSEQQKKKPPRIKVEVKFHPKLKTVTAVKGLNRGEQERFKQRVKRRLNGYCSPTVHCDKNNALLVQGKQVDFVLDIISELSIPSTDVEIPSAIVNI